VIEGPATAMRSGPTLIAATPPNPAPLDHDDFGLNQSKIMNVIDS